MKDTVISYETDILKALGFITVVVHPHKFILNFTKILEGSKELSQLAWSLANDR
jgi:hypothetical protein